MTIRISLLRVLLAKERLRLRKQPLALLMLGLLAAISILISMGGPQLQAMSGRAATPTCWIVYDSNNGWIDHLKRHLPQQPSIKIVAASAMPRRGGEFAYPSGDGAIELLLRTPQHPRMIIRYPGLQPSILWPHTQWFWGQTVAFIGETPAFDQVFVPMGRTSPQTAADVMRQTALSDLMTIEMVGGLLLFGVQLFSCVHLLISFTSQERERGTLLALALTPASLTEILLAKCLFHGGLALSMCTLIVAILQPQALGQPLLWGTLLVSSVGFLSIGVLIASLARTQATAALLTLCYLLGVALVSHLSKGWAAFALIRQLMFEHNGFLLIHASLKGAATGMVWQRLGMLTIVVLGWVIIATETFKRRGWRS